METSEAREDLLKKIKKTKSNRFHYSKRLQIKAKTKSIIINILSVLTLVMGVYIIAYAKVINPEVSQYVSAYISAISLISLLLSLEDSVVSLSKRSSDAHRCGRDISKIYGELKTGQINLQEAARQYEDVVSRYEDNHDGVDYKYTLYELSKEKNSEISKEQNFELSKEKKTTNIFSWAQGILPYWISAYSSVFFTIFLFALIGTLSVLMPRLNSLFSVG